MSARRRWRPRRRGSCRGQSESAQVQRRDEDEEVRKKGTHVLPASVWRCTKGKLHVEHQCRCRQGTGRALWEGVPPVCAAREAVPGSARLARGAEARDEDSATHRAIRVPPTSAPCVRDASRGQPWPSAVGPLGTARGGDCHLARERGWQWQGRTLMKPSRAPMTWRRSACGERRRARRASATSSTREDEGEQARRGEARRQGGKAHRQSPRLLRRGVLEWQTWCAELERERERPRSETSGAGSTARRSTSRSPLAVAAEGPNRTPFSPSLWAQIHTSTGRDDNSNTPTAGSQLRTRRACDKVSLLLLLERLDQAN